MEPFQTNTPARLTNRVLFVLFFILFATFVLTERGAASADGNEQHAASLPLRRPGRKALVSLGTDTGAAAPSVDSSTKNLAIPALSAVTSGASSSEHCPPTGCQRGTTGDEKKNPVKLLPSLMIHGAVPLTDTTYFDFIKTNPIVLVLFYAPWCSWSKKTLPEFDSAARVLAQEQSGEPAVLLAKVDCTQNEEVMIYEEIEEYPTIKLFVQGRSKSYDGGRQRTDFLRWVQLHLNQGQSVGSIDSLKEIFASRALGTLVVIAAWQPDRKTVATAHGQSDMTTSPNGVGVKEDNPLVFTEVSFPQEQKIFRSGASRNAETYKSATELAAADTAHRPTIHTGGAEPFDVKVATRRQLSTPPYELSTTTTASLHSPGAAAKESIYRKTFQHVARLAGTDVIFGEVSKPEVVTFLLNKYVQPYTGGQVAMGAQLPFIGAFPAKVVGGSLGEIQSLLPHEEIRLYDGKLDDAKHMANFVRSSKFPAVVPFTDMGAPKLFEDGRPVCVLFVDSRSKEKASPEVTSLSSLQIEAFLNVAPEFRERFLFTIAGNSLPHEKRLTTLLGVEDALYSPQLRIVRFNPPSNDTYYPAVKYRPDILQQNAAPAASPEVTNIPNEDNAGEVRQQTQQELSRSETGGLRRVTTALGLREKRTGDSAKETPTEHSQTTKDFTVKHFEQELRSFLTGYLEGLLKPYLRSEPVPSDEESQSDLKIIVGATFDKVVRLSSKDVLVEFGAPWCGHCRKLEPTLKLLAAALHEAKSSVVLAKMDATRNEVDGLYFVGYPTLVLFPSKNKKSPLVYEGERSEEGLLKWLARNTQKDSIRVEHVKKIIEKRKQLNLASTNPGQRAQTDNGSRQRYSSPTDQSVLEEL